MSEQVVVPSIEDLINLREVGREVGYRGIYIYLRYRAILSTLKGRRFSRALSVGCGYGIFDRLLPGSIDFTGVDIGSRQIQFALNWAKKHRPTYRYVLGDFREVAFPSESFDMVVLSEVIEHIPEEELPSILSEVERVIAPGGLLLLSVPNRKTLRNRARMLLGMKPVLMDQTHLREYELSEIQRIVAALPYQVVKFVPAVLYFPMEEYVRYIIRPHSSLRDRLIALFPATCSHFIYLLRK